MPRRDPNTGQLLQDDSPRDLNSGAFRNVGPRDDFTGAFKTPALVGSGSALDLLILMEPGTTATQTTTSATTSLRAGGGTGSVKVSWSGGSVTLTPGAAATTVSVPSGTSVTFDALALTSGPCAVYGN